MSGDVIDAQVIEEPGTDLAIAGAQPPATLFRTDDPSEVIRKASDVATALAEVLKKQNLTSMISDKEYVRVEGWTLLGTMLGVFPVVEWTRPVENGWEARVEARTMNGATIGAAEAECLRSESKWRGRDDYALRSMAQTRAVSKALRAPLGFIVTMAGFEATPAEEIPDEREARRKEGPAPFPVPKSWPKILTAAKQCDNPVESEALYAAFLKAATYHLYGTTESREISTEDRRVMAQKAAGAVCWLHDTGAGANGPFYYFGEDEWRQAWAAVLDGHALEIPDYVPPPPEPEPVRDEIAEIGAESFGGGYE